MARLTWRDHADLLLDGKLDAHLSDWREDGLTIDQITRRLEDDHDIEVSRETVRVWLKQVPTTPPSTGAESTPGAGPSRSTR